MTWLVACGNSAEQTASSPHGRASGSSVPDAAIVVKLDIAPPPTGPVAADEQLRLAADGKIVKRTKCGDVELLVIDPGLEGKRTRLTVGIFDPDFVLGDRKQGRWSVTPVEELAEMNAAEWGDCIDMADHPTLFVALTKSTYAVLVREGSTVGVVDRGARPADVKVTLIAKGKQLELRVGDKTRKVHWPTAPRDP